MGADKNIKLHIVTDIKRNKTVKYQQSRWFTAKSGFLIPVVTDLDPESVACVPTNMESSGNTDSVCADSASESMPTTSASRSSSKNEHGRGHCVRCVISTVIYYNEMKMKSR